MLDVTGRKIHFSGIGGTGMVAGARLAVEAGWEVRGSDNPLYPPSSHMVTALGVPVANFDPTDGYVVTDIPELEERGGDFAVATGLAMMALVVAILSRLRR